MDSIGRCKVHAGDQKMLDLQCASEFQTALLGMAAHDLRQPLQVLKSVHECLSISMQGESEQAWLARGERALVRLTEQLDHLLGALRLYEFARSMEVSPVDLGRLLERLGSENEDAALEKGVLLRVCPTSAVIMSNPVLLDGVLRNLVRNAVKYTERGGRILIGCRRVGAEARIDVYDTGLGMAPEQLPRIFEAFQRLDSTRPDGLGLGLFVVRRAINVLGHRMEVGSIPSRGSRFTVWAPRYDAP